MMMKLAWDAHSKTCMCGYLDPETGELVRRRVRTNLVEITQFLAEFGQPLVVYVEASRESQRLCRWFMALGIETHMLHAGKLRRLAEVMGAKSDDRDARLMTMLTYSGSLLPLEVYVAPEEVIENRNLARGRQVLRKISTLLRNLLRVILHLNDVEVTVSNLQGKVAKESWESWSQQLPPKTKLAADILWRLLTEVESSIAQLDAAMREESKTNPIVEALTTIPGIGKMSAFQMVAEVGDIQRFDKPEALVCYAGLAPMSNDSDGYRGPRKLPRRCNRQLRYLFYQAAQAASRCKASNRARDTYRRVRQRWDARSSKVAAAREIVADVFYTWKRMNLAMQALRE